MKFTTAFTQAAILMALLLGCNPKDSANTQDEKSSVTTEKKLVPGEQAPLADPDQNSFGRIRQVGTTKVKRRPGPRFPEPELGTVHFDSLTMSDPFIFPDEKTNTYYLTGTGGPV
jgi:hypothetical protein